MRFIIVLLLIVSTNLFATVINIPDDFETIQAGIDEAEDGDTVLVAGGTYTGEGNRDISFQGKAIFIVSESGPEECIIDIEGEQDHRGFRFSEQETRESVLDGFTITGGNIVTHVGAGGYGGGITMSHTDNEESSPTIRNCHIINNYASVLGGGIHIGYDSYPLIENCIISANRCEAQHTGCGGGISIVGPGARAYIVNCTITQNSSPAGDGVAVRGNNDGANGVVTIHNSIIYGNGETNIFVSEGRLPGEDNFVITYSDIGEDRDGEGNINEDPLFTDPDNSDYHLTENSPCIDTGDPDSPEDPDGTRADMGAYYFPQRDPDEDGVLHVPDEYETIQEAIEIALDGDSVVVEAGEYVENINFLGKDIVVMGDPNNPEDVIIDGNEEGTVVLFANEESENTALLGFTIQNGRAVRGGGITCIDNSSPTLEYLIVKDNYGSITCGGIWCMNESSPTIRNVVVSNNTGGNGSAIALGENSSPLIENTTICFNSDEQEEGVFHINDSHPVIRNCIFWGNEPYNISFYWGDCSVAISYTDLEGGIDDIGRGVEGEVIWGDGNIDADPLFADPDNGDYHLTEDSPCIDAGDPDSPEDPDGSRADMGAYYFRQEEEVVRDIRLIGRYDAPGRAYGVKAYGDYAYVANDWEGLRIVSITDPSNPQEVGHLDTPSFAISVEISGNYAYVADMHGGLRVMDISDPENPREVDVLETPDEAIDVTISGNIAYIADRASGLRVVDISDPDNVEEIGAIDTPGYAAIVDVQGNYAYVADNNGGLRIISISDPENPEEVGQLDTHDKATGVAVSGDYAYVADWEGGLLVVNISNPENPEEVSSLDTPDRARDLSVAGNLVFIANQGSGLYIVDVRDPENPEEVGHYDTDGSARDVFISGSLAYVADDGNGVLIFDVSEFTKDLTVPFHQGWNLISINVSPGQEYYSEEDNRGPDIPLMMEQLRIDEDSHHVLIMKNERGRFYVPEVNFNNIPYWDLTRGYRVKVDEDVEAAWSGEPIPADSDIWVNENWNMIAYFPNYELDMRSPDFYGISPIVEHVVIMKDANGRFAYPSFPFSNMPPLRPTQGYQIKVDEDVLLNYPPEQEGERIASAELEYNRH